MAKNQTIFIITNNKAFIGTKFITIDENYDIELIMRKVQEIIRMFLLWLYEFKKKYKLNKQVSYYSMDETLLRIN